LSIPFHTRSHMCVHTHTNAQTGGYNKNGSADRQITSRSSRTPKGLYGETNCSTGQGTHVRVNICICCVNICVYGYVHISTYLSILVRLDI